MVYGIYKNARNAAWQCIIDYNINKLPVKVSDIIKASGIALLKDSDAHQLKKGQSGKTIIQNDKFYIIYNDTELSSRCRFTIAHELGHVLLGHLIINTPVYRTFAIRNDNESAANVFARDLLAPACVLHELCVHDSYGIAELCGMSLEAANYRAKRMKELEDRNAWYKHPLERKVYEQFEEFILTKRR